MCSSFLSRVVPLIVAILAAGFTANAHGQVLNKVSKVGHWVEFDGDIRSFDGIQNQPVRARFACVEADKVDAKPGAWVEVEWTARERSNPLNYPFRMKLLVPNKLDEAANSRHVKCRTYVQYPAEPAIRPAKAVSEETVADMRGRYCGCVPPKAVMTEPQDEEILTGDQVTKTRTKLYRFVQTDSDGDKVEYRFWLADEIPFGVAKYAYKLTRADGTGGECEMTFRRKGDDAKPQWPLPPQ